MEHSRIQDWVKDSKLMNKYSHKELKSLVEKYPFFEVTRLLLLKNLNDNQSIRFEEELRNSSLHISNRRQLYLLLNNRLKLLPFHKKELKESVKIEDSSLEQEKENLTKLVIPDTKNEEPERGELFEISDSITIVESEEKNVVSNDEHLVKDSEILELNESGTKPIQQKSDSDLLIAATEVYHIGYGGNLYTLKENENQEKENHSFNDWMEVVNKRGENLPPKKEKEVKPKKNNLDLIDNFIQKEPSIQRSIKVTNKQEDISVDSVRENDSFMSETLASIYMKQKLFDRAIAVYQKLELKNPEKKVYFAGQIEKIEKIKK